MTDRHIAVICARINQYSTTAVQSQMWAQGRRRLYNSDFEPQLGWSSSDQKPHLTINP